MEYSHLFQEFENVQTPNTTNKPPYIYIDKNTQMDPDITEDDLIKVPKSGRNEMTTFLQTWDSNPNCRMILIRINLDCPLIDFVLYRILENKGILIEEIATYRCIRTLAYDTDTVIQCINKAQAVQVVSILRNMQQQDYSFEIYRCDKLITFSENYNVLMYEHTLAYSRICAHKLLNSRCEFKLCPEPINLEPDLFQHACPGILLGNQIDFQPYILYKFVEDTFEEVQHTNGSQISINSKGRMAYNYHYIRVECYKAAMFRQKLSVFKSSDIYGQEVADDQLSLDQLERKRKISQISCPFEAQLYAKFGVMSKWAEFEQRIKYN